MPDMHDFTGKVILVTGAGGVLCGCIAIELARRGAKVAAMSLRAETTGAIADEITAAGHTALAVPCNVLDKKALEEARKKINDELGLVDILINGAGGNKKEATAAPGTSFFDLPDEAIRQVMDLNFLGSFLPSQVFVPDMVKKDAGVVLNVSSMNGVRPLTRVVSYSAGKAAINNFTQWLAVHLCQNYSKNIRVNALAPGFFLTKQNKFLLTDEKTGDLTDRGQSIIDHTPMARFGNPEDLLGATLWLCSDASKFVTGSVVTIDGGFSAFSGV